jgi:peptide/nickel transport system substrate-binding protein
MVASYHPRELTLVRNPRFREWSKAAQPDGYPDGITVTRAPSTPEAVRATERGSADVAWVRIPPRLQRELETQYASELHLNPVAGVTYLFLNTRRPPFDDLRARRAGSYAADRAEGVRASTRLKGGRPTCQVLPPQVPGFERYCPYTASRSSTGLWRKPDLERARQLVARSGTRGELVTLWIPDNHRGEGPFAAALLRSLGHRVRLERVSNHALAAGPTNRWRRVQAGLFSWLADYPAASNYIDLFFACSAFYNWSGFCHHRIDAQIQHALELQATDPYRANRLWARIDRAIVDQAPVVPLFTLAEADFVSRRVGNYQYSLQWGVLLDQLWVH